MIRVFAKRDLPVMDIIELQGRIVITPEALADARSAKAARRAARLEHQDEASRKRVKGEGESEELHTAERTTAVRSCWSGSRQDENRSSGDDASASHLHAALPSLTLSALPSSNSSSDDESLDEVDAEKSAEMHNDASCSRAAGASADLSTSVVEVPLGHVEQDHLSEQRCTLCIDTLRVDGRRSTYKHPLLVLKECSPSRMQQLRRQLVRRHFQRARHEREAQISDAEGIPACEPTSGPSVSASTTTLFSEWQRSHPEALSLNALYLDDIIAEGEACVDGTTAASAPIHCSKGQRHPRAGEDDADADVPMGADFPPAAGTPAPTPSAPAYKSYELIGVVRNSVLFNSKPARVFQR
ncbi:hypothetical protein ABL78_4007 [Leptomonas seymouri]|uniref:Uncharacterized protein n=1 Tax=Leptomonas seymouri TaxID=5684 RepID=A0A0N1I714_LEPSE|nr:hypothetical protein ABL78_4007 [Leptomonas seymouri]|eukprot:KPI86914.1 hypothetical protein ABL78_4007 [Leptomonas seymouri]